MDVDSEASPDLVLQSLCQHVRAPLATAKQVLECERKETTAERDAFEAFSQRLSTIDACPETVGPSQAPLVAGRSGAGDQLQCVRAAYRETVMSVPHYDDMYGESMVENVAAEFGSDLAAGIGPAESQTLTQPYKTTLRTAAVQAVQDRVAFIEALDRETQSLADARTALSELLTPLNTTTIPECHRAAFTDQLDCIAYDRQETLRTRRSLLRLDGHSLCGYLYQGQSWMYPVLTAATRLRDTVVL
jgi:hypothetical protein